MVFVKQKLVYNKERVKWEEESSFQSKEFIRAKRVQSKARLSFRNEEHIKKHIIDQ
jgi:hypothetical protein